MSTAPFMAMHELVSVGLIWAMSRDNSCCVESSSGTFIFPAHAKLILMSGKRGISLREE